MADKLIITNLSKSYNNLQVIDNWNLSISQGERIAFLGPSGSGKTTFLRIISGLETPDSGSFVHDSLKMSFVFQEPRLIPWRNVKDNLLFVNEQGDYKHLLTLLKLKGFETYYPSQLSGGMAQRVNLARALIVNPDLLILDEAFTSLDFKVKYSIMQDINQLWQQRKFTIIFVTHDLKEALILADRIILLSGRPSKIKKVINIDSSLNRSIGSLDFLKLESELIELVCND